MAVSPRDLQLSFQGVREGAARLPLDLISSPESSVFLASGPFAHLLRFRVHDEINPTFQTQLINTETISGGRENVLMHEEHMGIE